MARVEELVKGGAEVNAFDEIGKTPLHYAAEKEHFTVVEYLLGNGAETTLSAAEANAALFGVGANIEFRAADALEAISSSNEDAIFLVIKIAVDENNPPTFKMSGS